MNDMMQLITIMPMQPRTIYVEYVLMVIEWT